MSVIGAKNECFLIFQTFTTKDLVPDTNEGIKTGEIPLVALQELFQQQDWNDNDIIILTNR